MHIVHLANAYGPTSGGLRTAMHEMAKGYISHGHRVTLVVAGAQSNDEETPFGRRITVIAPELPGSGGYRFIVRRKEVAHLLETLQPERIEVSDRTTLRWIGVWAKQRKIPNFMWAHERVDGVLKAWGPPLLTPALSIADWHNKTTSGMFDQIVCTTAFAEEEFIRIGSRNTVRVPLGVDVNFFRPDRRDEDLRKRLVGSDEHLLLMTSRLSPEKHPEIAIDALAELRARGVKARLVIAGAGPREGYLRRHAWGLPVEFLGFVKSREEIATLQASADVVLAPGPIETFGLAALEALACGTSVVASDTSALREIIVGDSGITVAPQGVAFAEGIQSLVAIPWTERAHAARARAEEFPWARSIEQVLALHGDDNETH